MWDNFWEFLIKHYVFHTVIVVGVIFLIFGKYASIRIGKNGLEVEKNKSGERDDLQDDTLAAISSKIDGVEKRLDGIDDRLDGMNKQINSQYQLSRNAAIQAANGVVWGDKSPPFMEVIKAGLLNMMLHQNGNLIPRMKEVIIGFGDKGIQIYKSILNEFINNNTEKLDDHFYKCIEEIKAGIY